MSTWRMDKENANMYRDMQHMLKAKLSSFHGSSTTNTYWSALSNKATFVITTNRGIKWEKQMNVYEGGMFASKI